MPRALASSALILSLLAGCQAAPLAAPAPTADPVILKGRVEPGRRVLAVSADLVSRATVSLIDASGVTRAAGVTTETGAFTLYQSRTPFSPTNGQAYTLQAMKRVDTPDGARWLSLRTELLRENGQWRSISGAGDDIAISMATTAIAKIDQADATLAPTDVMDAVASGDVTGVGDHTEAEITAYAAALEALVPQGIDPGGPVVYTGDVTLRTQADVDRLLAYDAIDGGLSLSLESPDVRLELPHLTRVSSYVSASSYDVTSLAGLRGLTRVGSLEIGGGLTDLRGLERLTAIDAELIVSSTYALTSLRGLENLASCGTIRLYYAESLADVSALSHVTALDELIVNGCPSLTSLHGFEGLTTVSGDVRIGRDVWVYLDGPESGLTSLAGLDNLSAVGGSLVVARNQDMVSYDGGRGDGGGLSNLTQVGGDVEVRDNGTNLSEGAPPTDCDSLAMLKAHLGAN
jgi:hypothetical protein